MFQKLAIYNFVYFKQFNAMPIYCHLIVIINWLITELVSNWFIFSQIQMHLRHIMVDDVLIVGRDDQV